ncbi:hypothetical protein MMC30_000765 [Trapelia coarctata]|nr:hypothetical protein [Trapelia coarctata]
MFFSLFARSVFERMWCVQEVAVAQRVRLVCGGASISWDEMIVALDYLSRLYDVMLESNIMVELYKGRLALQKQLKDIVGSTRFPHNQNPQQWPSLTTLIITTRNRGATDPKDKVFALAGLFKLMGLNLPPPDYAKSVRQVYQEITKAAISQYHSLDILYHVTGFANSFDLPSWVPDLSDTRHPMPLMYPAFSASATSPPYYRFSDTALTLTLWGKSLGPITALGDPVLFYAHAPSQPPPPSPTAEADALLATFKQWSSLAHSLPSYPNGQPIAEAFARTLFTNGIYHDIRGPADFLAVFPTWHALLTSATSSADLSDSGVENMLRDVAAIPAQAVEKREFALSVAAAIFGLGVGTMRGKGKRARLVHAWLGVAMRRKRFFVMGGGFMGVVGGMGEVGDEVVLFAGLRVPFLVGRAEGGEGWRIKGPAYVHGVMEGEGWREGEGLDEFVVV